MKSYKVKRIKDQIVVMRTMCFVYIVFGLLSLLCLTIFVMWDGHINPPQEQSQLVKPKIEKIIEYADDDPIVIKHPFDVIEEKEQEIVEDAEEEMTHLSEIPQPTAVPTPTVEPTKQAVQKPLPTTVITESLGTVQGPQEVEKYYNLPMHRVVQTMRNHGYSEEEYPYYVNDNGVKMLGEFIMVAADLEVYPRGTVVQTSLGQGLVCDKCETPNVIDLAVEW